MPSVSIGATLADGYGRTDGGRAGVDAVGRRACFFIVVSRRPYYVYDVLEQVDQDLL